MLQFIVSVDPRSDPKSGNLVSIPKRGGRRAAGRVVHGRKPGRFSPRRKSHEGPFSLLKPHSRPQISQPFSAKSLYILKALRRLSELSLTHMRYCGYGPRATPFVGRAWCVCVGRSRPELARGALAVAGP